MLRCSYCCIAHAASRQVKTANSACKCDNRANTAQSVTDTALTPLRLQHNSIRSLVIQSFQRCCVFEVSDPFYGPRERHTIETKELSERMTERISELPDEELLRLASLSAQVMHLAGDDDSAKSGACLSLAAACNCELVIRRARVGMMS
jgi:hypothetical protein